VVSFSRCERKGQLKAIDRGRQNKYALTHRDTHTHIATVAAAGQESMIDKAT